MEQKQRQRIIHPTKEHDFARNIHISCLDGVCCHRKHNKNLGYFILIFLNEEKKPFPVVLAISSSLLSFDMFFFDGGRCRRSKKNSKTKDGFSLN